MTALREGVLAECPRPGQVSLAGAMSDPGDSDPSGTGEGPREAAQRIADQLAPMLKLARAKGFDFLAYLIGMALKESRRLSQQ